MSPFLPMSDMVLQAALSVFSKVSLLMSGLVALVVVDRVAILVMVVAPPKEIISVFMGAVFYFLSTKLFPFGVSTYLDLVGRMAWVLKFPEVTESQEVIKNLFERLAYDSTFFRIIGAMGDVIAGRLSQAIYTALISLMISIGPVVIFLNTLMGLSYGLSSYLSAIAALSLWPVLWNLLGLLAQEVAPHFSETPLATLLFWGVIQFMQLCSPVLSFFIFQSASGGSQVRRYLGV